MPTYFVEDTDTTTYRMEKTHEVNVPQSNGKLQLKSFTFKPGKRLPLPQDIALLFLDISPNFKVRNSRGQVVRPRKLADGEYRTVQLRPDEVVVSVTQVLKPVLLEMARNMPGGEERFSTQPGDINRIDIEEFIITGGVLGEDEDDSLIDTVVAP